MTKLASVISPTESTRFSDPAQMLRELDSLQSEVTSLNAEIDTLRRRDSAIDFSMKRMDEELRLAARLQQDFLPKSLPVVGTIRFHTLFRPAGYVSGDLYDVMRLDETHVGFYQADAVGHGIPAALLTMFIKNALVTKHIDKTGYRLLSPSETVGRLNDVLVEQHLSNATFATAIYGYVNTRTMQMSFARGGHPNPILLRADGTSEILAADGSLLGIFEDEKFATGTAQLTAGDRVFIFTDGLEIAFSNASSALMPDQWRDEIVKRGAMSTEQILNDFSSRLDNDSGSLSPKDDVTVLVIEAGN